MHVTSVEVREAEYSKYLESTENLRYIVKTLTNNANIII